MKSKNLINASTVDAFLVVGYTVGVLLNKYTTDGWIYTDKPKTI